MLGSNILEEGMLNDTLKAFRDNNDSQSPISATQGVMLLDGWLQALEGDSNIDQLKSTLNELRAALQASQPDESYVRQLLGSLADQAQVIAEAPTSEGTWTGGLVSLSKILRKFSTNQ
ncbi:hypothetical protein [Spirosoma fluviale]|uniref:Uncharacterized protein n=1 Tax=Spirosoma fluviale TaxID=1597977 RepID=A0A286GGN4_9BACT|nr:hypothetical protein [Spirosoma fluviale]SOD94695.1 hypothetical protein SAMN06269250_4608 [Spirosoma fluviale]